LFYLYFVGNKSKSSKRREKRQRRNKTAKTDKNRQKPNKPGRGNHRATNEVARCGRATCVLPSSSGSRNSI